MPGASLYDALGSDKDRAEYALSLLQQLYAIERRIKEEQLNVEASVLLRQQQAVPLLSTIKEWMTQEYSKVLPKSPVGQVIGYCLPSSEKLCLYTANATLIIDNNPVENAIHPVAVRRMNYLFAGSHTAAQRAAMIYSLFATCRLHHINPYHWLKDVLQRIHLYSTTKIHELLPHKRKKPDDNASRGLCCTNIFKILIIKCLHKHGKYF